MSQAGSLKTAVPVRLPLQNCTFVNVSKFQVADKYTNLCIEISDSVTLCVILILLFIDPCCNSSVNPKQYF